jgi:drug/metabolite transporter (DMT)-like permease
MPTSALFAICILIWGTTWFAITAQISVVAPEVGVALRFGLAALVLGSFCRFRRIPLRFKPGVNALILVQGLTGFGASYICVYAAERYVASGVVAVGYAASPLTGLVLARLFLRTPMSGRVALGGVIGILGVLAVFWHETTHVAASRQALWGVLLTFVSVLLASISTVATAACQRLGVKGWGPLAVAMAWGAATAALWALAHGTAWTWSWQPAFVGSLVYLALLGSVVTFGASYALVARVGPARAGYIGVTTPLVALVISSAFEGFAWTGLTVLGIALAILGNAVALWPGRAAGRGTEAT